MRTSYAIISALAGTAVAHTAYTTLDVTITSCGPEVTNCPGEHPAAHPQEQTQYSTAVVTVVSCGPEATSCPGKPTSPTTTPTSTTVSSLAVVKPHDSTYTPAIPSPPAPPAEHPVLPPPPAEHLSAPSVPASSAKPYPTSVVTVVSNSKGLVGTGTGAVQPGANATSTYPPIASFTGVASSLSRSIGVIAGLAVTVALFMA